MRNLLLSLTIILLADLLLQRCANISSPTGGPKDTIPPLLIYSEPANGTINYKEKTFTLEFSEFIKADKIQSQLIITPKTDNKYKTIPKKNKLIIKFEDDFDDSTTYNLNFADAVTDITENNPAINLSIAFSTGSYIDSLSISGQIIDLFSQEKTKGYTVGLYPLTDTLDFLTQTPLYFTTTNDSGIFNLSYIKSGNYRLLSFNDDNRNILLDAETETHGFIQDSIFLDSSLQLSKPIPTLLQNVKPIEFINARSTGPYIELKFNKQIDQYVLEPTAYFHNITGEENEIIRIYKTNETIVGDTITFYTSVSDSLGNQVNDTIRTAFIESNRKPAKFSYSLEVSDVIIDDTIKANLTFNKPIMSVDSAGFLIKYDTVFAINLYPSLEWNGTRTELALESAINKISILDSIYLLLKPDTVEFADYEPKPISSLTLEIRDSTFISVESDTSTIKTQPVKLEESNRFGTVNFTIDTEYPSFTLQLLNSKQEVIASGKNDLNLQFPKVSPGTYSIRVLIDNNQDGKWTAGNLLQNLIPEDIYVYPKETSVRENWVLEINISF